MPNLISINLSNNNLKDIFNHNSLNIFSHFNQLNSLDISCCKIINLNVQIFCTLLEEHLKQLTFINIDGNYIQDKDIVLLIEQFNTNKKLNHIFFY